MVFGSTTKQKAVVVALRLIQATYPWSFPAPHDSGVLSLFQLVNRQTVAEAPAVPWTLGLAVRGTGTWLSSSLHQPTGCQTVAQTLKAQVSRHPASSSGHCWSSQEQRNMAWALCSLHVFHCKLFSSRQRTGKLLVTTGAIINLKLGQGQSDTEGIQGNIMGGLGCMGPAPVDLTRPG